MKKISLMVLGGCLAAGSLAWGGDFVVPGDGTVYDRSTKLLWQQAENTRAVWQSAADRCGDLSLAGRSDWRLPTKEELVTLVDRGRTDPAVDTRFFPGTKSTAYWTGTREKDRAWGIGFSDGEEFIFGGTELALYARCVAEAKEAPPTVATAAPAKSPSPEAPAQPSKPAKPIPAEQPAVPVDTRNPQAAETLRQWADAWAKQDVAAYLSFYGEKFDPPGALGRSEWEKQRQRALTKPRWVKIELKGLKTSTLPGDRVRIDFLQSYRSDVFQDRVRKAIVLGRDKDRWEILSEETLAAVR